MNPLHIQLPECSIFSLARHIRENHLCLTDAVEYIRPFVWDVFTEQISSNTSHTMLSINPERYGEYLLVLLESSDVGPTDGWRCHHALCVSLGWPLPPGNKYGRNYHFSKIRFHDLYHEQYQVDTFSPEQYMAFITPYLHVFYHHIREEYVDRALQETEFRFLSQYEEALRQYIRKRTEYWKQKFALIFMSAIDDPTSPLHHQMLDARSPANTLFGMLINSGGVDDYVFKLMGMKLNNRPELFNLLVALAKNYSDDETDIPVWVQNLHQHALQNPSLSTRWRKEIHNVYPEYSYRIKSFFLIPSPYLSGKKNMYDIFSHFSFSEILQDSQDIAGMVVALKATKRRFKEKDIRAWWNELKIDSAPLGHYSNLDPLMVLLDYAKDPQFRRELVATFVPSLYASKSSWPAHTDKQMYALCTDKDPVIRAYAVAYMFRHANALPKCMLLQDEPRKVIHSMGPSVIARFLPEASKAFRMLSSSDLISDTASFLEQWAEQEMSKNHYAYDDETFGTENFAL